LSEIEQFDPEIKKIEGDIRKFLISYPLFAGQKSTFTTIKIYFITRRDITQEKLQKLTGFSRGTISQELKKLVEMGVIEKTNVSSTGEITYSMKSAAKAFVHSFINSTQDIFYFIKEMVELKLEMDAQRNELEKLHGFNEIYQIINLYSISMPFILELIKLLEKELAGFEKK